MRAETEELTWGGVKVVSLIFTALYLLVFGEGRVVSLVIEMYESAFHFGKALQLEL